ncbi:MAG: hypothetical protein Q9M92_02435 [Enterobacterales bacterium]|nr:hypothetical protein [Enterobacterales bacterium]
MKIKILLISMLLGLAVSSQARANLWWDAFLGLVHAFWDSNAPCPVGYSTSDPCILWDLNLDDPNYQLPYPYTDLVYIDTPLFIEVGVYGYEPAMPGTGEPWSNSFKRSCPDTSYYKDMSIISNEDGWINYTTYSGTTTSIKTFTVNQGVPFEFAAHRHH